MIVAAPGKLVLSGAYAVLEGAPAIVMAVDRFARADASRNADAPAAEVREALGERAPHCDVSDLAHQGRKLGLGSSAAGVVASLGAVFAQRGESLDSDDVKGRIFQRARAAHAAVQRGGSGVDVAASTHGGVLRYTLLSGGAASILRARVPEQLVVRAFFSGKSARTSDLRAQVDAFRDRDRAAHRRIMTELGDASEDAARLFESGSAAEVIAALRAFGETLERLGDAADVPIVPLEFRRLATAAASAGAWFLPSGAGGGDVGVYCGTAAPSPDFLRIAQSLDMLELPLATSERGVHVFDSVASFGHAH